MDWLNSTVILQTLIVAGLTWTAKVLWQTSIELGKVHIRIEGHEKRLDKLEESP